MMNDTGRRMLLKALMILSVTINLLACAGGLSSNVSQPGLTTANTVAPGKQPILSVPAEPIKSPHGYIISKDYELSRFGGFIGNCTDDQNWPYFWQCMSENAGNGGFE